MKYKLAICALITVSTMSSLYAGKGRKDKEKEDAPIEQRTSSLQLHNSSSSSALSGPLARVQGTLSRTPSPREMVELAKKMTELMERMGDQVAQSQENMLRLTENVRNASIGSTQNVKEIVNTAGNHLVQFTNVFCRGLFALCLVYATYAAMMHYYPPQS